MARINNHDVRRIADLIESYLNNHPNAADTAEGFAKWWLPLEYEVSDLVIEQALNYLSLKAIVTRDNNSNGHTIYSGKKTNIKTQSN
jgi:hypothetical protein